MPRLRTAAGCLVAVALLALCPCGAGPTPCLEERLLAEAQEPSKAQWMTYIRRALHEIPELGFQEAKTSAYVRARLQELGIPYRYPVAKTGITADIGRGAPILALRADMDALPIQEENDVDFVSKHPGRSHACGHDAHMAMLLGAAKLLKSRESSLRGTVRLLFQPAEEGPGGAHDMVKEGALEGVSAASALHVWPTAPAGTIKSRAGTILAARDTFDCTVRGRGGHASMPQETADAVMAAALTVVGLQALISRETAPTEPAVLTVARFNTGEGAPNVVGDSVRLAGTLRAVTAEGVERLRARLEQVASGTAAAHGCSASCSWEARPYPATVNDASLVTLVAGVAGRLARYEEMAAPSMGAEDFSFMAAEVPAVFTVLGIQNETAGSVHEVHTARFTMDDSQLPVGASLHAATALRWLETHHAESSSQQGITQAPTGDEL